MANRKRSLKGKSQFSFINFISYKGSSPLPSLISNIFSFSKKLTDPSLFPIAMQTDDPVWKVRGGFDVKNNRYTLEINGIAFTMMPYQATLDPEGPQNIDNGLLKLNGNLIKDYGLIPYSSGTLE